MRFAGLLTVFGFALPLFVQGVAAAQAQTFKVDDGGENKIQFVSDAPLEKFTGTSGKLSGEIKVDPNKPADTKAELKVPVSSIKTGIELRDEHLQKDNWLDAKKYPDIKFVITKVTGVEKLKPNEAVDATVSGKFTMHGVTKDVTATAKVRWTPAAGGKPDTLRVQASFPVKLEDHKVTIPSIVALKVAPEIKVNVELRASKK
jgi:polyisoprenoid-binding protein YceI